MHTRTCHRTPQQMSAFRQAQLLTSLLHLLLYPLDFLLEDPYKEVLELILLHLLQEGCLKGLLFCNQSSDFLLLRLHQMLALAHLGGGARTVGGAGVRQKQYKRRHKTE